MRVKVITTKEYVRIENILTKNDQAFYKDIMINKAEGFRSLVIDDTFYVPAILVEEFLEELLLAQDAK